jgi:hypothetical protein
MLPQKRAFGNETSFEKAWTKLLDDFVNNKKIRAVLRGISDDQPTPKFRVLKVEIIFQMLFKNFNTPRQPPVFSGIQKC